MTRDTGNDHSHGYPRDLIGYGRTPPQANWPGRARIAVQFVLNYEEGAESCVLHGDSHSEQFLSEIAGAEAYPDRHLSMESIYEYGSRAGVWRVLREFERRGLPLTVFGVAMALQRHPDVAQAFKELGHEVACARFRSSSRSTVSCPWAGTPAATAPIRGACCSIRAVFSMTATTTAMTCRSGPTPRTARGIRIAT